MVNYSEEFIDKCKKTYPKEKELHDALERGAWIARDILEMLSKKYEEDLIDEIINNDLSFEVFNLRVRNLRIGKELQLESWQE